MKYIDIFKNINPKIINECDHLLCSNIHFKDPFNDFIGKSNFKKMLSKIVNEVKNPKFIILDQTISKNNQYFHWKFNGSIKYLGNLDITGMSSVKYDKNKKVSEHIDYWDSSEYFLEKIPVLKWQISYLKNRFSV